jgi:hypothetical protein
MNAQDEALIRAYRQAFGSPAGREVLNDLMKVCRFRVPLQARPGIEAVDPNSILMAEGARMVFLRIISMLKLDIEQTNALVAGQRFNLEDQDAA